jgi:outer membrane lipoprotein LolB
MFKYFFVVLIIVSLTSCQTLHKTDNHTVFHLNTLSHWSISGAIAAKNKRKSWSAMLLWQQHGPHHYSLQLYGPLNGGTVWVEQRGQHITYQDGQKTVQSTKAAQLILTETGINIPVTHLYYWLRGLKAPRPVQQQQLNEQGQLITLQQDNFMIKFSHYTVVNNLSLPTKIEIDHAEGHIKIVIKQWDLSSA